MIGQDNTGRHYIGNSTNTISPNLFFLYAYCAQSSTSNYLNISCVIRFSFFFSFFFCNTNTSVFFLCIVLFHDCPNVSFIFSGVWNVHTALVHTKNQLNQNAALAKTIIIIWFYNSFLHHSVFDIVVKHKKNKTKKDTLNERAILSLRWH